jgi:hypothetical protein
MTKFSSPSSSGFQSSMLAREPIIPKLAPVSVSYDAFSPPREIRLDLHSGIIEKSPPKDNYSDGSASRVRQKERLDPAMMRPAGIQTAKEKTYSEKYSAHYSSEINNLNQFSPGSGRL